MRLCFFASRINDSCQETLHKRSDVRADFEIKLPGQHRGHNFVVPFVHAFP